MLYAVLLAVFVLGAFAFKTIQRFENIFQQLSMQTEEVKESIFYNFQDGMLGFPYSRVVTKLAVGKREAAVNEIGDYIKTYVGSAEFSEKYLASREEAKPQGVQSAADKLKEHIEQVEHDIEVSTADMQKASGDMKKLYEATLAELKKELKALNNPGDPNHAYYVKKATQPKDWESDMAAEDLKAWQEDYPPTVKEVVKKRLTQFLELTKDIDFNAKLVKRGNKMVFENAELEAKSGEWKRCFRCGPETIRAARHYAQQWLSSLR